MLQVLTWLFTIAAVACFVTLMAARCARRAMMHRTDNVPTDIVDVFLRDVARTTQDVRLRAAVSIADLMAANGRARDGRRVSMTQIQAAADLFARTQVAPGLTLDALARPANDDLLKQYTQGYWLISRALVREVTQRRKNTKTA